MRSTRPLYSTIFFLLLTFLTTQIIARAQDDEPEDYDVKARVVRISLLNGEANVKRGDNTDWESARLNQPLVEGDTISTAADSQIEIQIDAKDFVRLGPNSVMRIVTLRDEGVALSVAEGTASLRLAKFDSDKTYFEIDAPKTTLTAETNGLYRIDVGKDGRVNLTARDGGSARIYSETSGFALVDGQTAVLIVEGSDAGGWEMIPASERDSWDEWLDERERFLANRLRYDTEYYDDSVWGAEDLDAFGAWTKTKDYGWIWRPHTTAINNYPNWAPYRYGQWTWVPPYGWTWIGNEPWGWAPYHYGRWVHHNNYWAWSPRSQYQRKQSWWRPALVAFVSLNLSFGDQICWYPLSYHHRDPRSRNYHRYSRHGRDGDRRDRHDRDHRNRDRDHDWRGVTGIPRRVFGVGNPRPLPTDDPSIRGVVDAEPLSDLPIRPAPGTRRPVPADRTGRGSVSRRERVPGIDLSERPTGAAERRPGIALDSTLRRSRGNGREAGREFPIPTGGEGATERRPTRVVERTPRPVHKADPQTDVSRDADGTIEQGRPARSERTTRAGHVTRQPEPIERPRVPAPRPESIPSNEEASPAERQERPERYHKPSPVDTGERKEHRQRNEYSSSRPAPSERKSDPSSGDNPSPPRSEPSRNEPSQRSEPSPRNDPPPRSEPAPQRSEPAPRSAPDRPEQNRSSRKEDPR